MTALKKIDIETNRNQDLISNIRNLIYTRGIKDVELCRQTNIPPATLHKILTGKTLDPRISTLQALAHYFNVTVDELYTGIQEKAVTQSIPVISWSDCTEAKNMLETLTPSNWENWITIETIAPHTYGLTTKPSMEPRFPKGTVLIIDSNIQAQDGDLVIVLYPNTREATLREYCSDGPTELLLSVNPNQPQETLTKDINIIGVVLESRFLHHRTNAL
jgi:SOS-response transcriptional repressor LexA